MKVKTSLVWISVFAGTWVGSFFGLGPSFAQVSPLSTGSPSPSSTATLEKPVCRSDETDGLSYRYCLIEADPANNPDILYYFHHEGGTERTWFTDPKMEKLRSLWKKNGWAAPTVISISLGPTWLLSEKRKGDVRDLHALFVNVLMSKLESQLSKPRKGRHLLIGDSMGGFNALMLALKSSGHFEKVALLCPEILPISPFASDAEIETFIKRLGTKGDKLSEAITQFKREFVSAPAWENHDVLKLAPRLLGPSSPALFLSCPNDTSEYLEGSKNLAQIARSKGLHLSLRTPSNPSDESDLSALASFLAAPPPSTRTAETQASK